MVGDPAWRIGTCRYTVWRWKAGRGRQNMEHTLALIDLAESHFPVQMRERPHLLCLGI